MRDIYSGSMDLAAGCPALCDTVMLSEYLVRKKTRIEKKIGRPVIVRLVRKDDPSLLGTIYRRGRNVIIEYNDRTPGFFWHEEGIARLLAYVENGVEALTIRESRE